MIIKNALIGGEIKNIIIENGIITEITDKEVTGEGIDAKGRRVIPGLVETHSHGCIGLDTMDADFEKMCRFYAENGTTSWLPTTMTMDYDSLLKVCNAKTDFEGANILGFHFEGPYISKKYKGAQNEAYIKNPSTEDFKQFKNVKLITMAPELPGAMEFIKEVSKKCVVSIGHSDCDYDTAAKAMENGANCLTHTYNAMPPLHHRNPGPIGAAIDKNAYVQVICDGFHVLRPVVWSTYKTFGPERMTIISDSIRPAGLPDGEYESGGLTVVLKDNIAKLKDGTVAGSSSTLWFCVKKAVEFGIPFDDAVRMATATPAEMLGINKGKIEVGYDADLLIISDETEIDNVIIGGKIFK